MAFVAMGACGKSSHDAPPTRVAHDAASLGASIVADGAVDAGPPRKLFVTGAGRCGECHEKMFDEWQLSAHAQAMTSPLYVRSLAASGNDPSCNHCHGPLAAELGTGPSAIIGTEGVTCDVCHTLRDPKPGGAFRLAIDDMVKYGPRCDLKDHYFHRMGCSPEHTKAALCGTCHQWKIDNIPVFTEYFDYLEGPAAKKGEQCQDCHMPRTRAAIATGSPIHDGVPHHGFLGAAADLRARALALDVSVADDTGGGLAVTVKLSNVTAGHSVPSGLPDHRVIVRVGVGDDTQTRALGRMLVNDKGAEVPFWQATAVGSDTRIAAGGEWHDTFHLETHPHGTIDVDVSYRPIADAIAKQLGGEAALGHDALADQPMVAAHLQIGGSRTISVQPKPPGAAVKKVRK